MTTRPRPSSLRRAVTWTYLGPFVALGGLLLLVVALGALAIAVRLVLTFLA